MTVGTTFLVRNATVTNVVGHSYVYNSAPTPDEEAFGFTRYYNKFDLSSWDGVSNATFQGETADGSITKTVTIIAGDVNPSNPP